MLKLVAKEVCGKEAEALEELVVLSQEIRLDRKCEPNQKVLYVIAKNLGFCSSSTVSSKKVI